MFIMLDATSVLVRPGPETSPRREPPRRQGPGRDKNESSGGNCGRKKCGGRMAAARTDSDPQLDADRISPRSHGRK